VGKGLKLERVKAIIFDFGQTLVDASEGFRIAEKDAQKKIFNDLGLEDWEGFIHVYRSERKRYHNKKIFHRVPFWKAIYHRYKKEPEHSKLIEWEDEYWETVDKNRSLFPEAKFVISELAREYKLGIVTNSPREGRVGPGSIKEYNEIGIYFDAIVIAGNENIPPKPDPIPFKICLSRLETSPSQAVFVGDDLEIDIYGALKAGIKPIWIQHRMVKRKWEKPSIEVPIIHTLDALLSIEKLLDLQVIK